MSAKTPLKNIFVLGLDDFNRKKLQAGRGAKGLTFHGLLETHRIAGAQHFDFEGLLTEAEKVLDGFPGSVDAIVNCWDFPASAIHAILCRRFGLPGPTLQSVAKCDHKYWSRLEQQQAIPEVTPRFYVFDPFDEQARETIPLAPPFWVKPFFSYSSYLAFPVVREEDFPEAVVQLREGADRYGKPFFDSVNHMTEAPNGDLANPNLCLAEEAIHGQQCTVEGYSIKGDVESHGIVDTHWFDDDSGFSRYQYPSALPAEVQERLVTLSCRLVRQIGYDDAGFNIEFYHDPKRREIKILEINSRVSQSHSHIFEQVDGRSNHEIAVALAQGKRPDMPSGEGTYPVAAKLFVRRFSEDGVVKRVPARHEIERIEREFPGTRVQLSVAPGMHLSQVLDQDTYSYRLAMVHTAARDEPSLIERFVQIQSRLRFEVEPLTPPARVTH